MLDGRRDQSLLETLPVTQRKKIFRTLLVLLTIVIVAFWLMLLRVIVGPNEDDAQNSTEIEAVQQNIFNILNRSKEVVDQAQKQLDAMRAAGEDPTASALSPEVVAALKEKLEAPTSDWLAYENTRYGVTFRYPGDWQLTTTTPTGDSRLIASVRPIA